MTTGMWDSVPGASVSVLDAVINQALFLSQAGHYQEAMTILGSDDTVHRAQSEGRVPDLQAAIDAVSNDAQNAQAQATKKAQGKGALDNTGKIAAGVGTGLMVTGAALQVVPVFGTIAGGIVAGAGAVTAAVSPFLSSWGMKVGALFGHGGTDHRKKAKAFYAFVAEENQKKEEALAAATEQAKAAEAATVFAGQSAVSNQVQQAQEIALQAQREASSPPPASWGPSPLALGAGFLGVVTVGAVLRHRSRLARQVPVVLQNPRRRRSSR